MNNYEVAIIMATYNGEKFLKKQLDSIINQSYSNWTLFIQDDNSNDNTNKILLEYANKDKRIKLVKNENSINGAYINFFSLIKKVRDNYSYDYYFFADQDDIWKENKIKIFLDEFKKNDNKYIPLFIHSDMSVIDSNDSILEQSLNNILEISPENYFNLFFIHGYIWGCSSAFNKLLMDKVCLFEDFNDSLSVISHDNYFAKYAYLLGEIKFIDEQLILYRKHSSNVTLSNKFRLSIFDIFKKFIFNIKDLSKTHARVYSQTLFMLDNFEKEYNNKNTFLIRKIINEGGIKGVYYLYKNKVLRKQFSRTLGLYFIMITGFYKKYIVDFKGEKE